MSGNVDEWLEDCRQPHWNYVGAPPDGSAWTTGGDCSLRIIRSGGWYGPPFMLHLHDRSFLRADGGAGFRVARTFE